MNAHDTFEALARYRGRFSFEATIVARFESLLRTSSQPYHRTSYAPGHITGSAWIVDPQRNLALLTHHKKLNKWLQLGGHADGDSNIPGVALREAREESGLTDFESASTEIFDLDIHEIPERKGEPMHLHFDIRYLMHADSRMPLLCSTESHDLRWIALEKINVVTTERSILRMVEKTYQVGIKQKQRD